MSKLLKLKILFAGLYFIQGGVLSYFSIFQKPYLSTLGISRSDIAILNSLLLVPFILKIVFGWISDRFYIKKLGRRKPYMILGLIIASVAFTAISLIEIKLYFKIYAALIILISFSIALFDASTDAFAIDIVEDHEQGSIQTAMVIGKSLGVLLLSIIFGYIVELSGYSYIFGLLAVLFILPIFYIYKIKEKSNFHTQNHHIVLSLNFYRDPQYILLGIFGLTYSISSFGADGLITLYLHDSFQASSLMIGKYGLFKSIGAIAGSLLAGYVIKSRGLFFTSKLSLILLAFAILILAYVLTSENFAYIAPMWGIAWSFQEVAFLSLAMSSIHSDSNGFAFAILMALCNTGTAIGEGVLTTLSTSYSFPLLFSALAFFLLIPKIFLHFIEKKSSL